VATKRQDSTERGQREEQRAMAVAARAEVVEILAGAIFTLLIQGETPGLITPKSRQQGGCS